MIFFQNGEDHPAYTPRAKNFIKITLSHTVSKINVFLHFIQNLKMAAKIAGKQFCRSICIYPGGPSILLNLFNLTLFFR